MIKAIDMFIGPSKFVCNQAISWGIPRTRVIQIDNGTRELPYRCHEKTASQRPKFGYIGGLTVEKGIKTLLNAFQAIELADLFIYGGQPEELRAMFRDKIKSNIYLQGTINDDAKTVLLPKLDALIVPSIWHEIGPIVIQEAFAAKVPVICSALDPMTNRVNDGIDGLLFPAGDEDALRRILQRCIDEPDLLPRLRMGIRQPKSMSFHIENEILPLYQQLANQNLWDTAPKTLV
jgi:glycosyltransferase involved in cell wall biosynthesis